jgi:hypothetical protein
MGDRDVRVIATLNDDPDLRRVYLQQPHPPPTHTRSRRHVMNSGKANQGVVLNKRAAPVNRFMHIQP